MTRALAVVALFVGLTALPASLLAAEPVVNAHDAEVLRKASEIFDSTWSPFCPGRTLSSCTSHQAELWRNDVREWLAAGLTQDQIMERLAARKPGFQLETMPDDAGVRYGPWVTGIAITLLMLALGYQQMRKRTTEPEPEPETVASDEDQLRLRRELEALES